MSGCRRSEEWSCHDPITRHLKEGDSQKYSLKWQKELLLIQRSLKLFIPASGNHKWSCEGARRNGILELEWMMWTTWFKTTQWMILLARALKNLSISIFIKVLPTSVLRILETHLTTLTNRDGQCRCIERQPFLRFHLSDAKETKSGCSTERHLALCF